MTQKIYIFVIEMTTLITNTTIVNEGEQYIGSLLMDGDRIIRIHRGKDYMDDPVMAAAAVLPETEKVDGVGAYLLPGVIDDHVHFRDPGMTQKADMHTESMAAAAGGVTSVMDMPNVVPQTTTVERWMERMELGHEKMHVNYAFYLGATSDNMDEILAMDDTRYPGVKLFMGSSTGGMLVDRREALERIFRDSRKIIMVHAEDTAIINRNMSDYQAKYGEDPDIKYHPEIRSEEACYKSSSLAVELARKHNARLHIAHVTTAKELELLEPLKPSEPLKPLNQITGEACVSHLLYTDKDYERLGSKIKCNPSIKHNADRQALRKALSDGHIYIIGTDHAPHLLEEKQGGAKKAVSGMPMVQFSLVSMLELMDQGILAMTRLVSLMCHNPATLFGIEERGFLREGFKADVVLVKRTDGYEIQKNAILSKCEWSPREGDTLHWKVLSTWVNGQKVWNGQTVDENVHGEALRFV